MMQAGPYSRLVFRRRQYMSSRLTFDHLFFKGKDLRTILSSHEIEGTLVRYSADGGAYDITIESNVNRR